jgi:flavin-dependent dehydrogenase
VSVREHEVVVLGGGPAGAGASMLLAKRGHDVGLVRPAVPPGAALAESIPPSARRLLSELGVLDTVERAGFQRNLGNTVWWGGGEARTETFRDGESGFHVDRVSWERTLSAAARDAGVTVYDGAAARGTTEGADGWEVRCAAAGDRLELRAPWVLDATGRRGVVAIKEGRERDRSTTTVALLRRWRRAGGFEGADPSHTLVESYRDGWVWSVPLAPDVRCLTAMVDHRHAELSAAKLGARLDAELDKARHVGALRAGAEPLGPAWACSTSLYTARRFGRRGLLLVGDAGSFIDPLSSFGVKKALSSGWLAAVTVHTALVDAPMADMAVGFFDRRERDVYRSYRRLSADFFEEGARAHGHPYWTERARAARAVAAGQGAPSDPDAADAPGLSTEEVRRALDEMRARDRLGAVRGSTLRLVRRPAIVGHRIVLEDHLASDRVPEGLRYVRGVDLRRVVEVAPLHEEVPDGWGAYNGGAPPVALPDYLSALAAAFAAGLLEHRERGDDDRTG